MACGRNCGLKSGLFLLLFIVTFCVICDAAVHDENALTIDVAAEDSVDYSSDDIRCYCNLPKCVSTSYMCKSEAGVCFSEVVDIDIEQPSFRSNDGYKGRHGCLELLEDEDQRVECRNMPSSRGSYRGHPRSLFCCFKDLCNHVDSPENSAILNATRTSSTNNDSPHHPSMSSSQEMNMAASPGYNSNEVWFKAAIIAVPICGTVILFLLIFLAVKILKTDSLHTTNKLGVPYGHTHDRKSNRDHFDQVHHQAAVNSKKIPLLIHHHHELSSGACTNHSSDELLKHAAVPLIVQNETGINHTYDKKNEANAKLNTAHGHEYNLVQNKERESNSPLLGLHKSLSTASSNNVYRNVNLSLKTVQTVPQSTDEKLYDKKALNSVISWGAPSPSSSPV